MRSGWFWGTGEWEQYQADYYEGKSRPEEWKSSPLCCDHDFSDMPEGLVSEWNVSRVIDLRLHSWSDVRKSYRPIINLARNMCSVGLCNSSEIMFYRRLHARANGGYERPAKTFLHQGVWLGCGHGLLVRAKDFTGRPIAYAYWIIWGGNAYYMSGPSIEENVQHAVIWQSLCHMKDMGIKLVEMGQVDGPGMTEKERKIAVFKRGFGGEDVPYMVVKREV